MAEMSGSETGLVSLTVVLAGHETAIVLWFRDRTRAQAAIDRIVRQAEGTTDDFGHYLWTGGVMSAVSAVLLTELDRDHELQTDLALRNARAQANAQSRAAADPGLKFALARGMPGGPGLL